MRYAFELARKRKSHVTSATKSNGIIHSMPYWDERFAAIGKEYPDVKTAQFHIDILTAHFVQHPDWFDVVVGSNLFGDILSDLGPAIAGSIGLAPGGNINPEKEHPLMFEHLGEAEAARAVVAAIERVVKDGKVLTRDLGGTASTAAVGEAVAALV